MEESIFDLNNYFKLWITLFNKVKVRLIDAIVMLSDSRNTFYIMHFKYAFKSVYNIVTALQLY